jgi:hypothetical protein
VEISRPAKITGRAPTLAFPEGGLLWRIGLKKEAHDGEVAGLEQVEGDVPIVSAVWCP